MAKVDNSEHVERLKDWLTKQRKMKRPVGLKRAKRSKDGVWTFWKVTNAGFRSPMVARPLDYTPGRHLSITRSHCESSPSISCGRGLHLFPFLPANTRALTWGKAGYHVVQVEVQEKDIVAVPYDINLSWETPKLRVCRMQVIKEVFPRKIRAAQLKKASA